MLVFFLGLFSVLSRRRILEAEKGGDIVIRKDFLKHITRQHHLLPFCVTPSIQLFGLFNIICVLQDFLDFVRVQAEDQLYVRGNTQY